jgi:hypothetical protein
MKPRNIVQLTRGAACVFAALALAVVESVHAAPLGSDEIFADSFEIDTSCHDVIALPDGTLRTQITESHISYSIGSAQRFDMDMTKWESIWGAASTVGAVAPWPGPNSASPVIRQFTRDGYIAAKFHVPAGFSPTRFGQYVHAINPPGPPIRVSYSLICGDFDPAPGMGCGVTEYWPDNLSTGLAWKINSANPSFCALQPDTDYYLNIALVDILTTDQCPIANPSCFVYLQHTHN